MGSQLNIQKLQQLAAARKIKGFLESRNHHNVVVELKECKRNKIKIKPGGRHEGA